MNAIIVILGLCITFFPVILFCNYILKKISVKTKFDEHLEIVSSKKGLFGKIIAYAERLLFGILVSDFGFWMSELFINEIAFIILIICLVLYCIIKYFDVKNEK